MKKRALKLLTLSVCLLLLSAASVMAEEPVYFADASLEAAVESELGITDPTPTDMLANVREILIVMAEWRQQMLPVS